MNLAETMRVVAVGERQIVISREFNASREIVFETWTRPEYLKRWFGGPRGWILTVCDVDLTPGGRYRYVARHEENGMEMAWGGVYREVEPPARIVATERFDDAWYPGESIVTMEFEERDGRTLLTMTSLFESQEARDAVMASPMESGLGETFERCDEFLAKAATQNG
jgi:uncharacterized protein YndB with AHSA1/START domain